MRKTTLILVLTVLVIATGGAIYYMRAQQIKPLTIQMDGKVIVLKPGENVSREIYELARTNPGFVANSGWVLIEGKWEPSAKGVTTPLEAGQIILPDGHPEFPLDTVWLIVQGEEGPIEIPVPLDVPASWAGKYQVRVDGNTVYYEYAVIPDVKEKLFSITALTEAQWEAVQSEPHGEALLAYSGIVWVYQPALDTLYTGAQAKEFSQMVGEARNIAGSLATYFGVIVPYATETLAPTPSSTPAPAWLAYRFASSVTLEYPASWAVEVGDAPGGPESAWFRPGNPSLPAVGVDIYHRSLAEQSVADPHTWQPNEGGYKVRWSQAVKADDLKGILFIWGALLEGEWDGPSWLMVIYYSPDHELDIRLTTEFTSIDPEQAKTIGLAEIVTTRFAEFQHMIESVRIEPAQAPVTFRGTVRSGAELGEVKAYCPEGLYLVADESSPMGQPKMVLLRVPDETDQAAMLSDRQYNGKKVVVVGKYPAQEVFCEALICGCEDYILVEQIESHE